MNQLKNLLCSILDEQRKQRALLEKLIASLAEDVTDEPINQWGDAARPRDQDKPL